MKTGTLFLTNGNMLGNRLISYEFYDSISKGFIAMSEKQVKDGLKKGLDIQGFILKDDKLMLDEEGLNYTNLQMKSGVNNLRWKNDYIRSEVNTALIVVGKRTVSGKTFFETVNAMHARVEYESEKLSALMQVIDVYGIKPEDEKLMLSGQLSGQAEEIKNMAVEKKQAKKTKTALKPENAALKPEGKKETKEAGK